MAFTLIELLVVVAVIGILCVTVLPAPSNGQKQSKKVRCLSHLHQMGVIMHLYASSNQDQVPSCMRAWWDILAAEHGRGVNLLLCPSYPIEEQLICYDINGWTFRVPTDRIGQALEGLRSLAGVQRPAETAFLCCDEYGERPMVTDPHSLEPAEWYDIWSPSHLPYTILSGGRKWLNRTRRAAAARHGEGLNVLCFDGHSAWKRADCMTVDDWRDVR